VKGQLKGFDALLNLVLDDAIEFLRGSLSPTSISVQFHADTAGV
jgi:small nuclear ribonucleoprotein (snRNP)-like protein